MRTRQEIYQLAKPNLKDPIGPRTSFEKICRYVSDATGEYLFRMIVAVHIPSAGGFRTGLYAKLDGHYFIITAAHGIEPKNLGDVFASPRPGAPITNVSDPRKTIIPTPKPGLQERVDVIDVRSKAANTLDLLVLKVKPLRGNPEYLNAYDLSQWKPARLGSRNFALIIGFPEDYAQYFKTPGVNHPQATISMYVHATNLGKATAGLDGYNPKWHMLLNLNSPDGKPPKVGVKGVSGGPVWKSQSMRRGELWSPSQDELIGIQTGVYPHSRLIKVTKIEHAVVMAQELAHMTRVGTISDSSHSSLVIQEGGEECI